MQSNMRETPRRKVLGQHLYAVRIRAGLRQEDIAAAVERDKSHVSRWEKGKLPIDEDDLITFLATAKATSEETVEALRLHRDASDPNWLLPGIGRELAMIREYEEAATRITTSQPSVPPGPLQTRTFAESVIMAAGATAEQAQDWVEFRMARQDSLLSGTTRYEAIIGEYAVRYPACSREHGIEQLRFLLEVAERPHITIQVLPFALGYDPARAGSFVLIETDSTAVVSLDQFRSSATLTDPRDVRDYIDAAETLRRAAMSPDASAELIAEIAQQLESTT